MRESALMAVVGSRGRGPGQVALLGSVSNAVVHNAPCPVIVVPPGAAVELDDDPTVVCGVDGSAALTSPCGTPERWPVPWAAGSWRSMSVPTR